jgi:hypothetical protein
MIGHEAVRENCKRLLPGGTLNMRQRVLDEARLDKDGTPIAHAERKEIPGLANVRPVRKSFGAGHGGEYVRNARAGWKTWNAGLEDRPGLHGSAGSEDPPYTARSATTSSLPRPWAGSSRPGARSVDLASFGRKAGLEPDLKARPYGCGSNWPPAGIRYRTHRSIVLFRFSGREPL